MLFNSAGYLLFFLAVAALHFALPHRYRWLLLLLASYWFYMSWNVAYIALILVSTFVDYFVARALAGSRERGHEPRRRRLLLLTSLCANLGLLFVFKYWGFFNDSMRALAEALSLHWELPDLDVLLPVGISFYTFQTLGYTIEVYRGTLQPERHLGRFALYVALFPQLVAGPIERASRLLPQIRAEHALDWNRVVSGAQLFAWGLFKKVVIADRVSLYVDAVYGNLDFHDPSSYLLATYLFAFQIYCDFSGYTDMAIGSARILGFDLMENFRRPYFSTSMTEFWRRWHISLSTWLRDYLYIPLGGNRHGVAATYRNLLVTMLLGGLWHGASWNFVIWGAFHGVLLGLSRATLPLRDRVYLRAGVPGWLRDGLRMAITFHLACLGWVFFRAETLADSLQIVGGIAGLGAAWSKPFVDPDVFANAGLGILVLLCVHVFQERIGGVRESLTRAPLLLRFAAVYALLVAISLFGVEAGAQFIYFQF